MNFRDLVDVARKKGLLKTEKPRTYTELAEACGICRQYFYGLMAGKKGAQEHTVHLIAQGLGVKPSRVARALAVSRAEAE